MNSSWTTEDLDSNITFIDYRGRTPKKVSSGIRLITAKNVKFGFIQKTPEEFISPADFDSWMTRGIPRAGDVFFTTEAPLGNVAQLDSDEPIALGQRIITLQPDRNVIHQAFLKYFLLTPSTQRAINRVATGATVKGIKAKLFKKIQISYPSIAEQKNIVTLLDKAFADIEQARANTEKNIQNARELFDSYLQQVFSERCEEWEELTLQNAVSEDCSLSYGVVQPGEEFDGGIPVVRPVDLKKKSIEKSGLKRMDPKLAASYQRTSLSGSELLLCVRGETGTVAVSDASLFGANVTRGIVPIKFSEEKVSLDFAYFQFLSPLIYRQIKEKTYGTALKQINIRDLRQLSFFVPPIDKQCAISEKLSEFQRTINKLESVYKSKLAALDELKQSLLQQAFTGQLTQG
ncbi:hypothetical protein FDE04_16395 [Vibrio parahaemolyticus]|uniref:restriction endonuclease subunit S n=1 Tax=Vibrio parahaemolyticus TaxID=670 RepID=UPI0003F96C30|nr:restriction endonuclease subunit S [Vibrio parahaemolyticus]EGQ8165431.1 hypothetical protein [Vibrio parahaemolyticus]EGR0995620.1 restriction endonuclease subunit S [Vibrio parahaemolyticus]EGR3440090.1 restriction endonuclease subunit S [Vibrio parahaemolyticus]EIV8665808.1 restriction endonuclease subunit S [Vibrio parahaemolyticus]EJG0043362.1 restriction endonuclease subunit S [Vibrio parahaemolyticus]